MHVSASADKENHQRSQKDGQHRDEQPDTSDAPPHALPNSVGGTAFLCFRWNGHAPSLLGCDAGFLGADRHSIGQKEAARQAESGIVADQEPDLVLG